MLLETSFAYEEDCVFALTTKVDTIIYFTPCIQLSTVFETLKLIKIFPPVMGG